MRINIWEEEEYTYPAAYGFVPNLRTYLHEDDEIRDCLLVVPGGGYCMVVPPEAEIIAKEFYNRGMNAFVLTYTTDITMCVPLKKQPLADISRAVRVLRKNKEQFRINPDRITVCGFSAGAHVCGSLCTHFEDMTDDNPAYAGISNRPDASILCYPVITTGPMTHHWSVVALLGNDASEEELNYFSLEKNVKENTPPCFLWQTAGDSLVPVQNSFLYAEALRDHKIPYTYHVFPNGDHGLSLPGEAFFTGKFGEPYTMEQLNLALEHVKNDTAVNMNDRRKAELMEQFFGGENKAPQKEEPETEEKQPEQKAPFNPFPDISMWPELACIWLKGVFR